MNNCGECTACCTSFKIDWLNKPANTPCVHCDGGCTIHDTKDYECTGFNCSYLQSNVDNINLRPDKCGVIFEMLDEKTFLGTIVEGATISNLAKGQIANFQKQGYKVILSRKI